MAAGVATREVCTFALPTFGSVVCGATGADLEGLCGTASPPSAAHPSFNAPGMRGCPLPG